MVTNVRGCRQTVDDGVNGRMIPVRDAKAIAGAILELLQDPALRARMGAAAREKARREFDERAVFERVVRAYARLVPVRAQKRSSPTVAPSPTP